MIGWKNSKAGSIPNVGWSCDGDAAGKFNELYQTAIRRLVELGNRTWEKNAFLPEHYSELAEAADALRWLVIRHLFREAGDADLAAKILNGLRYEVGASESAADIFFRDLTSYVARALAAEVDGASGNRAGTSFGLVVWGDSHVERVARYSFASLRASGNIPHALSRGPVTGMMYTRQQDAQVLAQLAQHHLPGVIPAVTALPDALFDALCEPIDPRYGPLKYWLLGASQTLQLSESRQRGDTFFSVFPDCIYSSTYMSSLARLLSEGVDAVLLSGFAASESGMSELLTDFLDGGIYTVPADALLDATLKNLFEKFRSVFVSPGAEMLPYHLALFFYCGNHIKIHSPHYNIAALSAATLARIPKRFFMTLDSEVEKLVAKRSVHLHDLNDDYFATEVRPDDSDREACPLVSESEFLALASGHLNEEHLHLFRRPYRLRLGADSSYGLPKVEAHDVQLLMHRICDRVRLAIADEPLSHRQRTIIADIKHRAGVGPVSVMP